MLCALLTACATIGPASLSRDRIDYNTAVSESWKEQTLQNIVKLRYADMPLFMEVSSIVSGYSFERDVDISGSVVEGPTNPASLRIGGGGKFTDRPTITYSPVIGSRFNRNFLTPIPPSALLFLISAGWPADVFLPITLEAVNGLRAQNSAGVGPRGNHREYHRVIELFGKIQRAGALGMRIIAQDNAQDTTILVIRRKDISPQTDQAIVELKQLLGLNSDVSEYNLTFAEVAKNGRELAVLTRSILTIMLELAGQVDVPRAHIVEGRTAPSRFDLPGAASDDARLINIHHGADKPDDAFVAVNYRDLWFWIDDRDFKSKRTLAYLMVLFSLTESGGKEGLPLVTIPAG